MVIGVGIGAGIGMGIMGLVRKFAPNAEELASVRARIEWYNRRLRKDLGLPPLPRRRSSELRREPRSVWSLAPGPGLVGIGVQASF